MAVEYKDYYKTLGVEKTAGADDLRKAFRRLAREFHPDVAKDKKAGEARFKEINEAYEVLSDPEKRQKYDTLGPNWEQGGFGGTSGGGPRRRQYRPGSTDQEEYSFSGTGFSDFFESIFGSSGQFDGVNMRRRDSGSRPGRDITADIMVSLEEALRGSVRQVTLQRGPGGATETYQVKIPPGVHEGQLIRMAGQGEAGRGKGKSGDLYLRVRLERHPLFRVEDNDLYYDLHVAPWEAVLGARVNVPTLEGTVVVSVPPGSVSGQKLRLRGQGLPEKGAARGALYAEISVVTPPEITAAERALWERLAKISTFNPRPV